MDWKPNARTAPGPGIEPGLSGAQRRGRTATPPTSPIVVIFNKSNVDSLWTARKKVIYQNVDENIPQRFKVRPRM